MRVAQQPVAKAVQFGLGRGVSNAPPAITVVKRGPASINTFQHRGAAVGQAGEVSFLRCGRDQLLVHAVQLNAVSEMLLVFGGMVLKRNDLR